jgi:hypothetical protein
MQDNIFFYKYWNDDILKLYRFHGLTLTTRVMDLTEFDSHFLKKNIFLFNYMIIKNWDS